MRIFFFSFLCVVAAMGNLLADDLGNEIPANAKRVGPIPLREIGRTGYSYVIPGKDFTKDILVAKEIFEGNQLVERDLYQGKLDGNGISSSILNGIQRKWHSNGQLASEEPYENGVMNGTFKQWNNRGLLVAQYEMVNGTGVKRVYNDSGELILDENYHKGMLEGETMSVTGPENVIDISSFKEGASSGISVGFYKDGTIRSISWGGRPLIEFSKSGAAFDKVWQINGQRMSEKEYAQKAGGSPNLPRYFSDPNQYKQLVPQSILDALNKYRAMPRVKIPLEFDKDGKPVPAS